MPGRITVVLAVATVLSLLHPGTAEIAASDRVKKIPSVELEIRALSETEPQRRALMLKADRPSRLRFKTAWEPVGDVAVVLTGRAETAGNDGARRVRLQAALSLPDGREIQASREALVKDRSTFLFELFRQDDRPFTLAIVAEISQSWEVTNVVTVGPPVRFEIEVIHVDGNTQTSLERNMLHTFENQTVRYEYRAGPDPADEALTLNLTPLRLIGDLVEIKVNIEGRLPGDNGMTVVAREENIVVSRGVTSPIDVTAGDPPAGYRFQVRAFF